MPNVSMSVMKSIRDVCYELRRKYYGDSVSSSDYRDSYIVNHAVEIFPAEDCRTLLNDAISQKDKAEKKISKSINLRSASCEKLADLSRMLDIPEGEVLRRILYYSLENVEQTVSTNELQLADLRRKVAVLQAQIEAATGTLGEVLDEIARLEGDN